ncbi:GNAT family N-acetyltransferase [Saccharothrix variisporea]|uniref:Ribosomal protein S18 acetylase RimI-like enzyme n=1 Tax=Saccharothrix variisporea TaxID=543527 RepID=A0A495XEY7_9PSEU|nr:GNAT family N-acetyltransferase [Saccharothrix variisporea]RKT72577.1 ribosomal protein S18 acetylase RimI-like enzyme [Saccharothrix variisporea]
MELRYRPIRPHDDLDLDDSFTTTTVFVVDQDPHGFALREVPVDPPLRKVFPPDDDDLSGEGFVAEDGDIRGFVSLEVESWNRRLVIRQITVAPSHRGRGIGSHLMDLALDHGRRRHARTAWLETSSVNVPAVRAYQKMGFRLCGLDTTLYTGTPAEGETALYLARPL